MKILHASDFHLDSPLSRLDAEQAMARRRELRELPARLAEAPGRRRLLFYERGATCPRLA